MNYCNCKKCTCQRRVVEEGDEVCYHCLGGDHLEIKYIIRADKRVERVCKHGVGHTVYNPHNWGKWTKSHGCCEQGCCEKY